MLLCQELDALGGGLKTRLEPINVVSLEQAGGDFIQSKVIKYIEMHYDCAIVTFGMQGTGKSQALFAGEMCLVSQLAQCLLAIDDGHRIFLEVYEYFID